ncbi:hypothetical protein SAMN04488136_10344 [Vibrio xiamenensis]|uniref:Uncharacterized protein n=1 Tax=Vibrio xiamenensis TaxID=861298 RepID=A0A1G7XAA5_9VIBR|nr:NfeD family protein [Vibrio xiamenensis]SDG81108.1 hypothetical protein SAMN04488136_10344 [Vibrio xiamenensis]
MNGLLDYLPELLMAAGIVALAIEVGLLGFSTFILFFVGVAVFLTGLAMEFGWLEAGVNQAMWSSIVLTFMLALLLWKPLKAMQNRSVTDETHSDFAQQTFVLTGDIDRTSDDVLYAYSGINWKVRSQTPLRRGQTVKVVKTEVSVMWVEPVE